MVQTGRDSRQAAVAPKSSSTQAKFHALAGPTWVAADPAANRRPMCEAIRQHRGAKKLLARGESIKEVLWKAMSWGLTQKNVAWRHG
jgi:hypothetical protein